jgi:hypothetical protein
MALRLSKALRNAMLEKEAVVGELTIHPNTLTFGDGDGTAGADTITDSGSGLAGHVPGDKITVKGSAANDGDYEILSVSAGVIEVPEGSLTAETAGALTVALASCRGGSFNDIFRNCVMRIYSGSQPATAEDAEQGTLLNEITSGTPFVSGSPENGLNFGEQASNATLGKKPGEIWSGIAVNTGTAGHFRVYPNDVNNHTGADGGTESKIRFDGAIATSGAQLNMSNTAITAGGTTTIDSVAVALPTL